MWDWNCWVQMWLAGQAGVLPSGSLPWAAAGCLNALGWASMRVAFGCRFCQWSGRSAAPLNKSIGLLLAAQVDILLANPLMLGRMAEEGKLDLSQVRPSIRSF